MRPYLTMSSVSAIPRPRVFAATVTPRASDFTGVQPIDAASNQIQFNFVHGGASFANYELQPNTDYLLKFDVIVVHSTVSPIFEIKADGQVLVTQLIEDAQPYSIPFRTTAKIVNTLTISSQPASVYFTILDLRFEKV